MSTLVFGHKAPDTDSTGSPILWAWYQNEVLGHTAEAVLLGEPNTEAAWLLEKYDLPKPRVIDDVEDGQRVVIVDTNNPAELPANIGNADITRIIDHHRLVAGLSTKGPINITMKPLACTATIIHQLMGKNAEKMPDWAKGTMLACILSDTLAFRSPTTTDTDRKLAERLAGELGVQIDALSSEMFAAKSDVSAFSDTQLLRMDSKEFETGGKSFRVSVLETTSPDTILARKDGLMGAMETVAREDGVDQVLLFIVDIIKEEATLLLPNDMVRSMADKSFSTVCGHSDQIVLPGIVSRKKQIIPNLTL